jgi:hypothetical protein
VVAAKTIEQAVTELAHEADLATLVVRRGVAQAARDGDAAREAALTAEAKTAAARKAEAVEAARARTAAERELVEKVAALAMARGLAAGGFEAVAARLHAHGFFRDPVRTMVRDDVLTAVYDGVAARTAAGAVATGAADGILAAALAAGRELYAVRLAAEAAAAAEAARKYYIRVFVQVPREAPAPAPGTAGAADGDGDEEDGAAVAAPPADEDDDADRRVTVGPIPVQRADTVAAVERRIMDWLRSHATVTAAGTDADASAGQPSADAGGDDDGGGGGAPSGADAALVAKVVDMAAAAPDGRLHIHLHGERLPPDATLLSWPLEELAFLELKP